KPDQIDDYVFNGRLSEDDARDWKANYRERHDKSQQKALTQLGQRHNQAEQLIAEATGVKDPLKAGLKTVKGPMQIAALSELTRRSAYFDGTEDPIAVARELVPRIAETLKYGWKPAEIQKAFPDWQSQQRALRDGIITREQLNKSLE